MSRDKAKHPRRERPGCGDLVHEAAVANEVAAAERDAALTAGARALAMAWRVIDADGSRFREVQAAAEQETDDLAVLLGHLGVETADDLRLVLQVVAARSSFCAALWASDMSAMSIGELLDDVRRIGPVT